MKKRIALIPVLMVLYTTIMAQPYISLSTDVSLLHNFSPQQHFTAVGQTVQANVHITKKESAYAWICYYTYGKVKNKAVAFADSGIVIPNRIDYTVVSNTRYQQISMGWKHYFVGSYEAGGKWNVYGLAGFGLMFGRVDNSFTASFDTLLYKSKHSVSAGTGKFRRLTFDLGLGTEVPLGSAIFVFTELHSWLPASEYPSPYLYNNYKVPFVFTINTGIRVLMD